MQLINEAQKSTKQLRPSHLCIKMGSRKPHVAVVPFPAQGHASPMMKLSHNLVNHGIKVTFVSIQSPFSPIISQNSDNLLTLISIPQGTESELRTLIQNINQLNKEEQITHVIADVSVSWALRIANQMDLKPVAFVAFGIANLAFALHIPKLLQAGIIDANGTPLKEESICLSNEIPTWTPKTLLWSFHNKQVQQYLFTNFIVNIAEDVKLCTTILANSFYQLEPAACKMIPNILPIGPLQSINELEDFNVNMFPQDTSCLAWLDQQPPGSVIYAAFGSTVFCSQEQLTELACGFEIIKRPFLWVVRSDFTGGSAAKLPEGFAERVANFGKIVEWAPQDRVLSHPAVGVFFSHCGWNSTVEGLSRGVRFLCWPYAVDQFHNRESICGTWRVGLDLVKDENGVVTRDEIKLKVEKLVGDEEIRGNSMKFKEIAEGNSTEGGGSFENFKRFVGDIKK